MAQEKFTKGPWIITIPPAIFVTTDGYKYVEISSDSNERWIAKVLAVDSTGEANAVLIKAAPAMYEALKEFLKVINRSDAALHHYGEAIKLGEAALAAANPETINT